MELMAVLELLRSLDDDPLLIQSDSQYVIGVFTEWLRGWRSRGMKTASRKPVENVDLILGIDELLSSRDVEWQWVRGHVGHDLNEVADSLARYAAERARTTIETGSVPRPPADAPRHTRR